MVAPKKHARFCLSIAVIYKYGWNTNSILYRFCTWTTQDKLNDYLSNFEPFLPNHKPEKYLRRYASVQVKRNTVKRKQAAISIFRAKICGPSRCGMAGQALLSVFRMTPVNLHIIWCLLGPGYNRSLVCSAIVLFESCRVMQRVRTTVDRLCFR